MDPIFHFDFADSIDWLLGYLATADGQVQAGIAITSAIAIKLLVRPDKWRVVGMVVGLIGQPLWFYSTIKSGQYGVFLLCCWYSFAYLQGIWLNWGREKWQKYRMSESEKNTTR